ncbi:MAG: DJ-1/PfpI family protein [Phyllobacteriaceae bacterium]|jgi:transcriptional regulator GlxA family with amidase domain|nr:DJ-1/PfpI family protein [Phyllobacteriaceae bacterium]
MSKKVLVLVYPGCQALDVSGPVDVFLMTNELGSDRGGNVDIYDIELVAPKSGEVPTHGGVLRLSVDRAIDEISDDELGQLDTFMIAGGFSAVSMRDEPGVISFIERASARARRVASVCTSAFLFAQAGVLSGHRVTTHWRVASQLAKDYPNVQVNDEALVCVDGKVWSSGGISAGVDLALAMVEQDIGAEVARSVARMMVMFLARPGDQSQFRNPTHDIHEIVPHSDLQMQQLIDLIRTHPTSDLRRSALADKLHITERTLARRFKAFTGMTVSRFVEEARVGHARIRLEDSDETLERIAARSGFGSADAMRRVFVRHLSISPQQYRARFKSAVRNSQSKQTKANAVS